MSEAAWKQPILALNCGSSSLKFGLYAVDQENIELLCEGEAEEVGRKNGSFSLQGAQQYSECKRKEQRGFPDYAAALTHTLEALHACGMPEPAAVGHRFVHGGPQVRKHTKLTPDISKQLRAAESYAPLHLPPALKVLDTILQRLSNVPQVICLDTAFHRDMPDVSKAFALPYAMQAQGVERYGFHGLSLESILQQLNPLPSRLVVAHLGNGSSITAISHGASVDTTMGLTPTGGIMMGTRCGDLDPGLMIYLLRNGYSTADELEDLVDKQSGLLGVSGKSNDVRQLAKARKENSHADLALRMFCYETRKAIAGMAAALGGIDMLVFTGGIGEHAEDLREEICAELEFLGVAHNGNVSVKVLPSQEELQICKITARLAGA